MHLRHLTTKGLRLAFEDTGSGIPVLWQHGLGAQFGQPREVFPSRGGLRRITLACRGHESSDLGDPDSLSIPVLAGDALALLDHLGIERAVVGGISLGAAIGLNIAAFHPNRVSALILARPAWADGPESETLRPYVTVAELLDRYGPEAGRERFLESLDFRRLNTASPDNAQSLAGLFARPRPETTVALLSRIPRDWPGVSRESIQSIRCPALIIGTEDDHLHPLGIARRLAELIPQAAFRQIASKTADRNAYVAEFRATFAAFLLGGGAE